MSKSPPRPTKTCASSFSAPLLIVLLVCTGLVRTETIAGTAKGVARVLMDKMTFYHQFSTDTSQTIGLDDSVPAGVNAVLAGNAFFSVTEEPITDDDIYASGGSLISFPIAVAGIGFPYGKALPSGIAFPRAFFLRVFAPTPGARTPFWDDPELVAANPTLALPHERITVMVQPDDVGPTASVKKLLEKLAAAEGLPWHGFSANWTISELDILRGAESDNEISDALKLPVYSIGYTLFPLIASQKLQNVGVINTVKTTVRINQASVDAAMTNGTYDPESMILSVADVAPAKAVWPFCVTVYGIMQRNIENTKIDCNRVTRVIGFFTWVLTNSLAQSEIVNLLGDAIPFTIFKDIVEMLDISVTCKDKTASGGRGHTLLMGSPITTLPIIKAGSTYASFQAKRPYVFGKVTYNEGVQVFLSGGAGYMLHPAPYNASVLESLEIYQAPIMATAGVFVFNIPEFDAVIATGDSLVLDLPTIAGILQGDIRYWNHPSIIRTNNKYADLIPNAKIVVMVPDAPHGATSSTTLAIKDAVPSWRIEPSSLPDWPAQFVRTSVDIISTNAKKTPYSFAMTYLSDSLDKEATVISVVNRLDEVIAPNGDSIDAALNSLLDNPDIFRKGKASEIKLENIDLPGAYPLIIPIYFMARVNSKSEGFCEAAGWKMEFVSWLISNPDSIDTLESAGIAVISGDLVPHVLLSINEFKCYDQLLDLGLMAKCPLFEGERCSGHSRGQCLIAENTIKCVCDQDFTGADCSIPIPDQQVALKFGVGFGVSIPIVLLIIAIASWRRSRAHNIWMIERKDFVIEKLLARGGYSVVFTGSWKATTVAIKVVSLRKNITGLARDQILPLHDIIAPHDTIEITEAMMAKWHSTNTQEINSTALSAKMLSGPYASSTTKSALVDLNNDTPLPGAVKDLAAAAAASVVSQHVIDIDGSGKKQGTVGKSPLVGPGSPAVSPARPLLASETSGRTGSKKIATGSSKIRSYFSRQSTRITSSGLDELTIISRLRHPNIAFMIAACIDKNYLYLLMEYMDAGSLYDVLRNTTLELVPSVRLRLVLDACRGLQFLHQQDPPVLHMDLKTPNILVDSRFTAKLTDFGLSSVRSKVASEGTLPWTAPEVIAGKMYTKASDVYSIGIVLWELQNMKASIPWEGRSGVQIREAVQGNERPLLNDEHCPLGKPYAELIRRCWATNPLERPAIEDVVRALDKIQGSAPKLDSQWFQRNTTKMSQIVKDLPASMQAEIARGDPVTPLPLESVTMIFTDIVGFTRWSSERSAQDVSEMLAKLHDGIFDKLVARHGGFHLETIGDAYIVVLNFPRTLENHVEIAVQLAAEMCEGCETIGLKIRAGVHTGPAVATVVGSTHPKLTLLGDTVNTASRMETISPPGKVTVSESVKSALPNSPFVWSKGKMQEVKGKGLMHTYILESRKIVDETYAEQHDIEMTPTWLVRTDTAAESVLDGIITPTPQLSPKAEDSAAPTKKAQAANTRSPGMLKRGWSSK